MMPDYVMNRVDSDAFREINCLRSKVAAHQQRQITIGAIKKSKEARTTSRSIALESVVLCGIIFSFNGSEELTGTYWDPLSVGY